MYSLKIDEEEKSFMEAVEDKKCLKSKLFWMDVVSALGAPLSVNIMHKFVRALSG